ncbi:MAG: hypothetical protein KBT27_15590 [Prevotellaceae bacterium]|nr:hypothetical protein [Candidatus Faecinaster equi]
MYKLIKNCVFVSIFFLCISCIHSEPVSLETESVDEKPAIITGVIANRDIYPKTIDITISLPFYDRWSKQQKSQIWDDGTFSFEIHPYSLRDISMSPFIDRLLISPGDSLQIEIDFADFNKVSFTGRGSENNEKLHIFHMKYYAPVWPSFSSTDWDVQESQGQPKRMYENSSVYKMAIDACLNEQMMRFREFVTKENPSDELVTFCEQEIEIDYFSNLIVALSLYRSVNGENVSNLFRLSDVEHLFRADCFNSQLCALTEHITSWLYGSIPTKQRRKIAASIEDCASFLTSSTDNDLMSQMLLTGLYANLLENNDIDGFEKNIDLFNKSVTFPLLILSIRDRYWEKKVYRDNPRLLSEAILNSDKAKDGIGIPGKENAGLKMLRDLISGNEGSVIYISIGANWCPGTVQEKPHLQQLALDLKGQPIRIVNFYLDKGVNIKDDYTGIEDYHLTMTKSLDWIQSSTPDVVSHSTF